MISRVCHTFKPVALVFAKRTFTSQASMTAAALVEVIHDSMGSREAEKFDTELTRLIKERFEARIETYRAKIELYRKHEDYDLALELVSKITESIQSFEKKECLSKKLKTYLSEALIYKADHCTADQSDLAIDLYKKAYDCNPDNSYSKRRAEMLQRARGYDTEQKLEVSYPTPQAY